MNSIHLKISNFYQVATNGIIAVNEPSNEEKYLGQFPVSFGAIAPFMADLDTTDGRGNVYYREDSSSEVLKLASDYIKRGFPETTFEPSSVVIVTWKLVAPYQGPGEDPSLEEKVNVYQSFEPSWTHVLLMCNTITCCFEGSNSLYFFVEKAAAKQEFPQFFPVFFYSISFIQRKILES